tara:strand:- start:454 stop:624 length:171 start_codon:yes stop_codon:yes gene_type:complete
MHQLENIFQNQVLMTFLIASIWIIPGVAFSGLTIKKMKQSELERQEKRVSKLYPSS